MNEARCALALVLALGCSAPPARDPTAKPPLTDESACTRLCDDLVACGGAPGRCVATCEEDRARLRPGFEASFVSCVERELVPPACSSSPTVEGDPKARSEKISLCYSATLEAYAQVDAGKALGRVLLSICKRSVRCGDVAAGNEAACVTELSAHAKEGVVGKLMAAARDELVSAIGSCVEGRDCNETDPVAPCLGAMTEKPPKEKTPP